MIRSLIVTPQSTTWYTQGGRKMKLITALFAIMFLVVGCGPHFNMHAKPDVYDEKQQEETIKKENTRTQ